MSASGEKPFDQDSSRYTPRSTISTDDAESDAATIHEVSTRQHTNNDRNYGLAELKTTPSNILDRVASRLTTTSVLEEPPDGGKAWIQCATAWLVVFTTWGYVNSFGSFQTYYTTALDLPHSTVSWIGSIQVFLLFFVGAFSGRALDAGYFNQAYLIGSTIQVLGIFMTNQ